MRAGLLDFQNGLKPRCMFRRAVPPSMLKEMRDAYNARSLSPCTGSFDPLDCAGEQTAGHPSKHQ